MIDQFYRWCYRWLRGHGIPVNDDGDLVAPAGPEESDE